MKTYHVIDVQCFSGNRLQCITFAVNIWWTMLSWSSVTDMWDCGCHPQHRWCLENQFSNEAVSHSLHFNSICWHLDVAVADHIQCNSLQVSMTTAWIVLFTMLKRSPTLWYDFSVPSIHRVARTLVSTEWFLSVKLGARTLHDSYILHSLFPVITEYISTTPLSKNKKTIH